VNHSLKSFGRSNARRRHNCHIAGRRQIRHESAFERSDPDGFAGRQVIWWKAQDQLAFGWAIQTGGSSW
jgi:hypothetical protein